jgi:magnesium transporter
MRRLAVAENGSVQLDLSVDAIPELLSKPQCALWLDIADPTEEDSSLLRTTFGFHPLAVEDATSRLHERPKVDTYSNYYFLLIYAISYASDETRLTSQPVGLFVGPNFLVTVHQESIQALDQTLQRWTVLHHPIRPTVPALVYAVLDALVDDYFPAMDQVAEKVDELEDSIFTDFDETTIKAIFSLKRDLLTIRRVVSPERDVLNVLLRQELPIFDRSQLAYLQDVYDHIVRVTDSVDTYRDLVSSALDSYLSVQSNRLNEIVKILTIASIILMSGSLVAGIYGMNFDFMPELRWRFGYPWALALMVLLNTTLIWFFRRRKWL